MERLSIEFSESSSSSLCNYFSLKDEERRTNVVIVWTLRTVTWSLPRIGHSWLDHKNVSANVGESLSGWENYVL